MPSSLYTLHKDRLGRVLDASRFPAYGYERQQWLNELDVRAGDTIEFHAAVERNDDEPEEAPAIEPAAEFDEVEEAPIVSSFETVVTRIGPIEKALQ